MSQKDEATALASAILTFRRRRSQILASELYGEPAWELLLELFIADAYGARLTGRMVAERSGTSGAVMSRWLKHVYAEGLIVGDGEGNLDDELTLSGTGMDKIERLIEQARNLKNEFIRLPERDSGG